MIVRYWRVGADRRMRAGAGRLLLGLAVWMLLVVCPNSQAEPEMVLGIYPYLSATEIVEQFSPLQAYLAQVLGQPVNMLSARDFNTFVDRTRRGDYDIVFTAPHMGRLAEQRDGWKRLVQTGFRMEIVVVTKKNSRIRGLADLRGRTLAVGSRQSMSYQIVDESLRALGMSLERDVQVLETPTFSNVVHAVARGEADAGATGLNLWEQAPPEELAALRLAFRAQPSPGFLVMANPRLSDQTIRTLQRALVDFVATPEGAAYFRRTRQVDFRLIDEATMRRVDPFTAVLTEQP